MIDPRYGIPLLLAVGYVIGSTPFGMIIARLRGVDLRKCGSGNIGATNVARTLGKKWGYLCFTLDMLKGLAPTLAAVLLIQPETPGAPTATQQAAWLAAGGGTILGHVFSFWVGFRGGKGVATALGVVLGIFPFFTYAGLVAFALWIAVTLISRYVSLASVLAATAFVPLMVAFNWPPRGLWPLLIFAATMALLIIIRHRTNIRRLLAGTENKIGGKK